MKAASYRSQHNICSHAYEKFRMRRLKWQKVKPEAGGGKKGKRWGLFRRDGSPQDWTWDFMSAWEKLYSWAAARKHLKFRQRWELTLCMLTYCEWTVCIRAIISVRLGVLYLRQDLAMESTCHCAQEKTLKVSKLSRLTETLARCLSGLHNVTSGK